MKFKRPLKGPYEKINVAFMQERAGRLHDPRYKFYEAILSCDTFEDYYRAAGDDDVQPDTTTFLVNADMEIKYTVRRGWITKAP